MFPAYHVQAVECMVFKPTKQASNQTHTVGVYKQECDGRRWSLVGAWLIHLRVRAGAWLARGGS